MINYDLDANDAIVWSNKLVLSLWGPPAAGKSTTGRYLAEIQNPRFTFHHLEISAGLDFDKSSVNGPEEMVRAWLTQKLHEIWSIVDGKSHIAVIDSAPRSVAQCLWLRKFVEITNGGNIVWVNVEPSFLDVIAAGLDRGDDPDSLAERLTFYVEKMRHLGNITGPTAFLWRAFDSKLLAMRLFEAVNYARDRIAGMN